MQQLQENLSISNGRAITQALQTTTQHEPPYKNNYPFAHFKKLRF